MKINFAAPNNVILENNAVNNIAAVVKQKNAKKILCVFGERIKATGISDMIIDTLKSQNVDVITYEGAISEPPKYIVKEIYELGREKHIDVIIAIGGGSTIDAAKAANLMLTNNMNIEDMLLYKKIIKNKGKFFIAVPTTAGTGSEVTGAAVITDEKLKKKLILISNFIVPDLAIIDPILTLKLPKDITVSTGIDVFSHAYEAYTSSNANDMSDTLALRSFKIVVDTLPQLVDDLNNEIFREKMSYASMLAGLALNGAGSGMGHTIAHSIGAKWNIAHGYACALASPESIKNLALYIPHKAEKLLYILNDSTQYESLGEELSEQFMKFNEKVGVPNIEELGIDSSKNSDIINSIADDVINMTALFGGDITQIDKNKIMEQYSLILNRIIF